MSNARKLEEILAADFKNGSLNDTREVLVYDLKFKPQEAEFIIHTYRALRTIGANVLVETGPSNTFVFYLSKLGVESVEPVYRRLSIDLLRLINEVILSSFTR